MRFSRFGLFLLIGMVPTGVQSATVVVAPENAPALGRIVRGSQSDFQIATNGTVTKLNGTAIRLTAGGVSVPQITLTCDGAMVCRGMTYNVTVTAVSNPLAAIQSFSMTTPTPSGGASIASSPAPVLSGSTVSFRFTFRTGNNVSSVAFNLGMTVRIAAGGTTGAAQYQYTVLAAQ